MPQSMEQNSIEVIEGYVKQLEQDPNDEQAAILITKIIETLNPLIDEDPKYSELRDHAYAALTEDILVQGRDYVMSSPGSEVLPRIKSRRIHVKTFLEFFQIFKFDCVVVIDDGDSDNTPYIKTHSDDKHDNKDKKDKDCSSEKLKKADNSKKS